MVRYAFNLLQIWCQYAIRMVRIRNLSPCYRQTLPKRSIPKFFPSNSCCENTINIIFICSHCATRIICYHFAATVLSMPYLYAISILFHASPRILAINMLSICYQYLNAVNGLMPVLSICQRYAIMLLSNCQRHATNLQRIPVACHQTDVNMLRMR